MIDSLYIKIGLVVLGTLVMLSSLVDVQGLISKIIFKKKSVVENNASSTKESDFL